MKRFEYFNKRDSAAENLSNQALSDILETGDTSVVCPICNQKPQFSVGRTSTDDMLLGVDGSCFCGYIFVGFRT